MITPKLSRNINKIFKLLAFSFFSFLLAGLLIAKSENVQANGKPPLEKKVFIHYRQGFGKPIDSPAKPNPKLPSCYGFLAKGAYWKETPIDLVIDPDNEEGLTQNFINNSVVTSLVQWDATTSAELLGDYSNDSNSSWDNNSPDGRNEILFDSYSPNSVISVTVIWGYFSGLIENRKIVEFDILFNKFYQWGDASVDPSLMDLQNIATHEIGHGLGMDDVYQGACSFVTMYGYSTEGDIAKRTLEVPDITGIQKLYGI